MISRQARRLVTRAVLAAVAWLVVTVASISPARSSEEWSFEVFQPIWTANSITLSRVTVLSFNSSDVGASAALHTCDSNQVATDSGSEQRNAAFEVGLGAEVAFNSGMNSELFGDTLRVVLHRTKDSDGVGDFGFPTILAATVQCIIANAAQSPSIRFVDIRVVGADAYRNYGGRYATSGFRNGPRKRVFN